jgi:hypothetical protein
LTAAFAPESRPVADSHRSRRDLKAAHAFCNHRSTEDLQRDRPPNYDAGIQVAWHLSLMRTRCARLEQRFVIDISRRRVLTGWPPMLSRLSLVLVLAASLPGGEPFCVADEAVSTPSERDPRVLFIVRDGCEECDAELARLQAPDGAFATLRQRGWRIGAAPTDHIQIVNIADIPDLVERWQLPEYPAVICVENGEILRSFKDGCSTPLDPYTFGWLLKGFDERERPPLAEAVEVETSGHYPLRGNHWSVDGDWSPDHERIVFHLRGANHNTLFPQEWPIESWSTEELRSLHDDLHEQSKPLSLLTGDEASVYVARPAYRAPAGTYGRAAAQRPAGTNALSRAAGSGARRGR